MTQSFVVNMGVVRSTTMTVGQLKLRLQEKFDKLLGDFIVYSPEPRRLQRQSFQRQPSLAADSWAPSDRALSRNNSTVQGAAIAMVMPGTTSTVSATRERSMTMPTRPVAAQTQRKPSSIIASDDVVLESVDNVESSLRMENAPEVRSRVRFAYTLSSDIDIGRCNDDALTKRTFA